MRRRELLATAGALLSAGCGALTGGNRGGRGGSHLDSIYDSDIGVDGPVTTREDIGPDNISVETPRDINVNVSDEIEAVDVNTSNFDTDIDGDIGGFDDEERGQTPTPANERTMRLVTEAVGQLREGLDEYTSFAGRNAGILDVDPTVTSFDRAPVVNTLDGVAGTLEEALQTAEPGQTANIQALRQVYVFVRHAAFVEHALARAYERFDWAMERLYNENTTRAELAVPDIESRVRTAQEHFQVIQQLTQPRAMAAFDYLSESEYEQKVGFFEGETEAFVDFMDAIRDTADGIREMQRGVDLYRDDNYRNAERYLSGARGSFSTAGSSFEFIFGAEPIEPRANRELEIITTLEQAMEDLERAAEAQQADNRSLYFDAHRAAVEHIESNEVVNSMRTLEDIR